MSIDRRNDEVEGIPLLQVLLPFIRAKANRLYSAHTTHTRGILALALQYQANAAAAEQVRLTLLQC